MRLRERAWRVASPSITSWVAPMTITARPSTGLGPWKTSRRGSVTTVTPGSCSEPAPAAPPASPDTSGAGAAAVVVGAPVPMVAVGAGAAAPGRGGACGAVSVVGVPVPVPAVSVMAAVSEVPCASAGGAPTCAVSSVPSPRLSPRSAAPVPCPAPPFPSFSSSSCAPGPSPPPSSASATAMAKVRWPRLLGVGSTGVPAADPSPAGGHPCRGPVIPALSSSLSIASATARSSSASNSPS